MPQFHVLPQHNRKSFPLTTGMQPIFDCKLPDGFRVNFFTTTTEQFTILSKYAGFVDSDGSNVNLVTLGGIPWLNMEFTYYASLNKFLVSNTNQKALAAAADLTALQAQATAAETLPFTWATKPASPFLGQRIRLTDYDNRPYYWTGTIWAPSTYRSWYTASMSAAFTGSTAESALFSCVIPGGMLGPNGVIRVSVATTFNATAGLKNLRLRFGGSTAGSGTLMFITDNGSSASNISNVISNVAIRNKGVANAQAGNPSYGGTTAALLAGAVDTTVDQTLWMTAQLGVSTDTVQSFGFVVDVMPAA